MLDIMHHDSAPVVILLVVTRCQFVSFVCVCIAYCTRKCGQRLPIISNKLTHFTFQLLYSLVCYDTHHLTFHRNGNAISTTMLAQTGERKEQKENPKRTT